MKKKLMIMILTMAAVLGMTACSAGTGEAQEGQTADLEQAQWIPEGTERLMSETAPNKLLAETIIDYYEIPQEELEETRYYYNYVDLDGDGAQEIFSVIIGPYTSGSGGNSALWCQQEADEMKIRQAFTLVNPPVLVADVPGKAEKMLILENSG